MHQINVLMQKKSSTTLIRHQINIKKGMPLIFLTNTVYYDNYNKTLPEGMELNDLVLLDNSKFEFLKKNSDKNITKQSEILLAMIGQIVNV